MTAHADLQLQIARQRIADEHRVAHERRIVAASRAVRNQRRHGNRSIRRVIGGRVIRVGEWLAADGELRPAGSS